MHIIKRYANRKLYDTSVRHYVSLADVAATVRAGEEVEIRSHATNADLTAQILAQIIFEKERTTPHLPVEGLLKIIRTGALA